jgi:Fe-S-cluster containining protein
MGEDACAFLDGARCTVYEARPTQCRTFPFWKENLRRRGSWEG